MRNYLDNGLLKPVEGVILVERQMDGRTQTGLVVALDLEAYDYTPGSQSLIRATEGTIINRLPPRMKVRRGAALELPHILVLYDDPKFSVLSPILEQKETLPVLYDFDLMKDSGHLTGRLVEDPQMLDEMIGNLESLISPETYAQKYHLDSSQNPMLFAMGDGNHSLATAKAIWEESKAEVGMDHPSRFALVEIVNLHDTSLIFEPIHRVLFGTDPAFLKELTNHFSPNIEIEQEADFTVLCESVRNQPTTGIQRFGYIDHERMLLVNLTQPETTLAVASLQEFLDQYLVSHPEVHIDYVHGDSTLLDLSTQNGNVGFYLPAISKDSFFRSVIVDGALPRKTFSMGHAKDKRFYLECRRIL